jgi:DNA-binding MarR family transcriptional regulator
MIAVNDELISMEQLSILLQYDEHQLSQLCKGLEARGYVFKRNEQGTIALTENDITVILSFIW